MHRRPRAALARLAALTLAAGPLACAPPIAGTPYPSAEPPAGEVATPGGVRYFERTIDLEPLLRGFPYERFEASLARDRLFFLEKGEGYTLKMLPLEGEGAGAGEGPLDLGAAVTISDVDWSTRSLWRVHLPKAGSTLWLHADARNDEQMNLWALDLESKALRQVTDHDYVYGFGFSPDEATIAYLPRSGKKAPFKACLRLLDVKSGEGRDVLCDSPELSYTWSTPRFSPDGREVYFNALVGGDRNHKVLVAATLGEGGKAPELRRITEDSGRSTLSALLVRDNAPPQIYIANDDGYANLYAHDRTTRENRRLTRLREDIRGAALLGAGIFAVSGTPAGSTLSLVDPK
ncbi:MAG: hypothetical protein KC420_05925, partial [Myxococcales bacterium]|nr:hypothetical protein [Myxococcales bacterium]